MRFEQTVIEGAWIIDFEPHHDERGFFARTFCQEEFAAHGLSPVVAQASISYTARRGTVRGLHWQAEPAPEAKLVRCIRGAIHDVLVDLREDSPRYRQHVALELDDDTRRAVYVPAGVAHGFQTLTDAVEVAYQMDVAHEPSAARGVRYDDPALGIRWPLPVTVISARDRTWPLLH